jgi:hypothetical protein
MDGYEDSDVLTPAERRQRALLTRPRIATFHEHVVTAIPCVPDDEATRAALRASKLETAVGIYLNYFGRFVPAPPARCGLCCRFLDPRCGEVRR